MENLSEDEKRVLSALGELEPATLEQIAAKTALEPRAVKKILQKLLTKKLLEQRGSKQSQSSEED